MFDKWTIIKNDEQAKQDHKICFYCKRFFCTEYHHPSCRVVCSGVLPQWEFLYFLMRNVKSTDTCKKFETNKIYKQNQR